MGKKTLYHPVSLHVIRGAFEYCEFKIGRLTQQWSNIENETAAYQAEITSLPDEGFSMPLWKIAKQIRGCFAQDITVLWVNQRYDLKTKENKLIVHLLTDAHENKESETVQKLEAAHEADLRWLSDVPQGEDI